MVARVVWDHEAAGSSPVTSTRLSLDARRVPELGLFFCLFARAYSGHLICCPDPGGEPPLPSRELHLGEVRDFCCPRFLWASSLFSLAKPGRTPRPRFALFFCLFAGACGGCPSCQPSPTQACLFRSRIPFWGFAFFGSQPWDKTAPTKPKLNITVGFEKCLPPPQRETKTK